MTKLRYKLTTADAEFCHQVICAGFHSIKYHTLQVIEDLLNEGVEGDFAECGVLYGAMPTIMLYALKRRGIRNRKVHLFDSFQGIPRATPEDGPDQQKAYGLSTGAMESSGVSVSSVANVISNMRRWGVYDASLIEIHEGWFQDTLPKANVGPLALLRSDVDLYESTRLVYQHLYDKVVPGGYVIDDDWGAPGDVTACRRAVFDVIGKDVGYDVADSSKRMHIIDAEVQHVEGQNTTAWWRKL